MDTTTQKLADALAECSDKLGQLVDEYGGWPNDWTIEAMMVVRAQDALAEHDAALKTSDSHKNTEALKGQQPRHEGAKDARDGERLNALLEPTPSLFDDAHICWNIMRRDLAKFEPKLLSRYNDKHDWRKLFRAAIDAAIASADKQNSSRSDGERSRT